MDFFICKKLNSVPKLSFHQHSSTSFFILWQKQFCSKCFYAEYYGNNLFILQKIILSQFFVSTITMVMYFSFYVKIILFKRLGLTNTMLISFSFMKNHFCSDSFISSIFQNAYFHKLF